MGTAGWRSRRMPERVGMIRASGRHATCDPDDTAATRHAHPDRLSRRRAGEATRAGFDERTNRPRPAIRCGATAVRDESGRCLVARRPDTPRLVGTPPIGTGRQPGHADIARVRKPPPTSDPARGHPSNTGTRSAPIEPRFTFSGASFAAGWRAARDKASRPGAATGAGSHGYCGKMPLLRAFSHRVTVI
jgi:hypothetical protein